MIICVFSPEVDIENIETLELRETIRSVTYLRWPQKNEAGNGGNHRMEFKHFWRRLYRDIMTGREETQIAPAANLVL